MTVPVFSPLLCRFLRGGGGGRIIWLVICSRTATGGGKIWLRRCGKSEGLLGLELVRGLFGGSGGGLSDSPWSSFRTFPADTQTNIN